LYQQLIGATITSFTGLREIGFRPIVGPNRQMKQTLLLDFTRTMDVILEELLENKNILIYYKMMKMLLVVFLLANALFWGLATHSQHCAVAALFGMGSNCPPHYVHLMTGLAFFCAAVYTQQKAYFDNMH
jgi:hypothetical protein